MATGLGFLDAEGVWQHGEDDVDVLQSDRLNRGQESISDQFTLDRARLDDLEDVRTHVQKDTTNSEVATITQIGSGKITGNGTNLVSETVTFPVAFASTPVIMATFNGYRATGAFTPDGGTGTGLLAAMSSTKTTTGFVVTIIAPGGTLGAANDWYYDWVAIGVPA